MTALLTAGCATTSYVDQRVVELETQSSSAIAQVREITLQNQADIQALTGRVNTVEQAQQNLSTQVTAVQGSVRTLETKINDVLADGARVAVNEDVFFAFGSFRLSAEARATLESLAARLKETRFAALHPAGHTDSVGGEGFNFDLGRKRAEAVAAYLAQQGIDRHKIHVISLGKGVPVASNQERRGRARNRRVEIRVLEFQTVSGVM